MSFDAAAVDVLLDKVQSHAATLGVFETVNMHEPKSAPGNGLRCAIWVQDIRPVLTSGLGATSGCVTLFVRIYGNMLQQPYDAIDPNILKATTTLMNAYTGDFDFGVTVRNIDLLGQHGQAMAAQAGYIPIDSKLYRAMTITLPVIVNDMWTQVG
jgi:hypothetical protein